MDMKMYVGYRVTTDNNFTQAVVSDSLETSSLEDHQAYVISLVLSVLYTIFLFPVGFIGNILILVVNLDYKGRLKAPDLYFVNLAVADLMLVADSLIEVFNLKQGYYDKAGLCTFMNLFQQANMYSSVFFLTWMSFDRFVALTGHMGRGRRDACISCCLIWVSSSLLTLLPFMVTQAQHPGELTFCFANVTQIQWLEVMLGFLLPFCVLGVCYWRIAQVLRRSQREQEGRERRPRRQKALKMISAAVVVFFLCWLPENAFISVHLLRGDRDGDTLWQDYPLTGHTVRLAAFSNSCLNPLIYSFLGETFQEKLKVFLHQRSKWTKLQRSPTGKSINVPHTGNCSCAEHNKSCESIDLI
ncbi:G-protein coupled estrogen receptor 1-like [Cynoglossus semilaevis]|uniref:G-protein coupled estrogen receptor 1-like n=1 Tax=Cynoglossus semilaevis TaxID=244447 RepID=UPI0004972B91|nr:G-protein coupled estrogen receptor 1-like [Cynoglossus semilaevis]